MSNFPVFASGTIGFHNETNNITEGDVKEVRIYPTNGISGISTESDTQIFGDLDVTGWEVGFNLLPYKPKFFAPLSCDCGVSKDGSTRGAKKTSIAQLLCVTEPRKPSL